MWQTPKAMSLEDIEAVKQEFVKAAIFCHECGFDGVQVRAFTIEFVQDDI